jgi:hypothetical protein
MKWSSVSIEEISVDASDDDDDDDDIAPAAPPRPYKDMAPKEIFGRMIPLDDLLPIALGIAVENHTNKGPMEFSFTALHTSVAAETHVTERNNENPGDESVSGPGIFPGGEDGQARIRPCEREPGAGEYCEYFVLAP